MMNSCEQPVFRIQPRLPRHERAFSLYDLLVTLTVFSTVTAIAVPAFQQLTSSQRIASAVNTLITALHLARSEAIKRREEVVLCPSSDGRACRNGSAGGTAWEDGYLLYIDRDGNHEFDTDETTVHLFGTSEGLHIRSTARRDHVTYQPNGMASGTNLTFTICDKNGRSAPRAVIVSNTGRPRSSTRNSSGGALSCPTAR